MSEHTKRTIGDVVSEIRAKAQRGEVDAAITQLNDLIATGSDKRVWEYEKACIQVNKSAPSDALRVASDFSARYPDYAHGILLLAVTLANIRRFEQALSEVDRSERISGPTQSSRSVRAKLLNASGRKAEAQALTRFDTSLPEPNIQSARTWSEVSPPTDEDQLREVLEHLRAAGETGERLALFEANWYAAHGQSEKAADLYEAANAKYPDHEQVVMYFAAVERTLGRHGPSQARLERAFKLNPTSYPIGGMLAGAYIRRLRFFSAIRVVFKLVIKQLKLS